MAPDPPSPLLPEGQKMQFEIPASSHSMNYRLERRKSPLGRTCREPEVPGCLPSVRLRLEKALSEGRQESLGSGAW